MATNHTLWIHAIMIQHIHEKYTVDLCYNNSNLDIATRNTWWIYVSIQTYDYSISTWIYVIGSRVFISIVPKYEYIHVIIGVEVEHGRKYLIIGHYWILLTSAREITIDFNDPRGILVQSIKCELMS